MMSFYPKWAAMVVVGKPVTANQAREIIIRTSDLYFSSNHHRFTQDLYEHIFHVKKEKLLHHASISDFGTPEQIREAYCRYGIIRPLNFLTNNQIITSYICGPHGWCNWDGTIFTNSYNVGKYPEIDRILKEWMIISNAFPYLDLKCQLYDGETCEDGIEPYVQFNVKDGVAFMTEIEDFYVYPNFKMGKFLASGCTIEEAIAALDYTAEILRERRSGK